MAAAARVSPRSYFSPDEWASLSRVSPWRGPALVAHGWTVILLAGAAALAWPWLIPLSVMVIGGRQLGLAILMHDAALGALHPDRRINDFLGDRLTAGGLLPYRRYHMAHHKYAQQEEAWSKGIVHRDLKPQNLFLADGGGRPLWKVLDFGVAALDESSGTLTQGKVVGTPAYMAPEQARGEKVDHRADIYALGAIAYRWLTGRPVCAGKDLHNALYQTVHVMPQKPSELAEVHVDIDAALAIALVKAPEDRWQSAGDLRDALARALEGNLDPRTRRRAADLLARHPWGAVRN